MGRARAVAPDAQRLTERTQRGAGSGTVVGDDLRAQQVLAGFGASYGQAEDRELRRAARFVVREGSDDADRELLLDVLGLDWGHACPTPNPQPAPELAWNAAKDCTRCKQPKPLTDYPADASKSDGRHTRCTGCQAAVDAARKGPAAPPKEPPTEQWCGTCKQTRPAAFFGVDQQSSTGLARRCKQCKSRADKDTRARRKQRNNQMEGTTTQ